MGVADIRKCLSIDFFRQFTSAKRADFMPFTNLILYLKGLFHLYGYLNKSVYFIIPTWERNSLNTI